jgi:bloom syndrome protein
LVFIQGADIPDVEQVIQFGAPSSLSVWVQRAGRAGRSAGVNARAILLVERSMFEKKKVGRRRKGPKRSAPDLTLNSEDEDKSSCLSSSSSEQEDEEETVPVAEEDEETHTWKKKVEEALRRWIEATGCRREVFDDYFDNPPTRKRVFSCILFP